MLQIDKPLSDLDLVKLCKEMEERANIVVADKPIDYNTSFKDSGHCIIWVPNKGQSVGHWTVAIRKPNNTCFFFDSFGRSFQHWKYVNEMFMNSNLKYVEYNTIRFQSMKSNLCGKYCLVVIALNKLGFTYDDIENFFINHQPCDAFLLKLFN